MKEKLIELVQSFPLEWQVLLLSAFPIAELRAAIPLGMVRGMPVMEVFLLAIAGNLVPVVVLLAILPHTLRLLTRWSLGARILNRIHYKVQAKGDVVDRYGLLGLFLFVAIPFPGTGAWSGALVAVVLEMKPWKSFIALSLGVVGSGVIITLGTLGLQVLYKLGGLLLFLTIIGVLLGFFVYRKRKRG